MPCASSVDFSLLQGSQVAMLSAVLIAEESNATCTSNEERMSHPDIRSAIAPRVTHLVGASRSDRLLAEIDVEMLIDL